MYPGSQAGQNPPAAARIRQVFGRYDKRVYQYYTSHTQSEAAEGVGPNEKGMDARANIFKKPFFVMMPFLAVVISGVVWWKGGYLLDKYRQKPAPAVAAGVSGANAAVPAARPPPSLYGQALATVEGAGTWRVVGTLINQGDPGKSYALLADGKGGPHLRVRLDRCEVLDDEPVRCRVDGFWYSETGRAEVASVANEPVKIWSGSPLAPVGLGAAKASGSTHSGVSSAVDGSDELARLAESRAGLDDPGEGKGAVWPPL